MRVSLLFALTFAIGLSGCGVLGGLFGSKDLTMDEVMGRYRFTEMTIDPTSDVLRDKRLVGETITDDVTLLLLTDGSARVERLRGGAVDATVSTGTFALRGRDVAIRLGTDAELDRLNIPREMTLRGGKGRLEGDLFQQGVNLEAVSPDYRGITQADITLKVRLRRLD
jgi:hypothetical protein